MALNAALLAALAAATLLVQVGERPADAVESTVRRYAAAVEAQALEAAVAELAPSQRDRWRAWVEGQLGNFYDVRAVAVRSPSWLDRLAGAPAGPTEVTVVLDINRGYPELFYQPTTRVGVVGGEGGWFLEAPLLAPEAASS